MQDEINHMEKSKCQIINFQHHTKNLYTYQDTQDGCQKRVEEKYGVKQ